MDGPQGLCGRNQPGSRFFVVFTCSQNEISNGCTSLQGLYNLQATYTRHTHSRLQPQAVIDLLKHVITTPQIVMAREAIIKMVHLHWSWTHQPSQSVSNTRCKRCRSVMPFLAGTEQHMTPRSPVTPSFNHALEVCVRHDASDVLDRRA